MLLLPSAGGRQSPAAHSTSRAARGVRAGACVLGEFPGHILSQPR